MKSVKMFWASALAVVLLSACAAHLYNGPHKFEVSVKDQNYRKFAECLYPKLIGTHLDNAVLRIGTTEAEDEARYRSQMPTRDLEDISTYRITFTAEPVTQAIHGIAYIWSIEVQQTGPDILVVVDHAESVDLPVIILPELGDKFIPECSV